MEASWIWFGVTIYVVIALVAAVASRAGKSKDMSDYFLGGRKMGGFVSAMSYSATTYSAFMMVGLAGLTYAGGVGALGFELLYLCGVSLILIFGPRFWRVGQKFGFVTPSEMLGHRYRSRAAGMTTALASCVFLIPYAGVQLAGVGYLLSGMSGGAISFTAGTVLATILAILFATVAGLRSVAWTDSLQSIMMIVSATLVVVIIIWQMGGIGTFFGRLEAEPGAMSVPGTGYFTFSTFLGLALPWIFFAISNPQVSQRLYTPASMKDLRKMLLGFLLFGFIYTMISVIWGFTAMLEFPDLEAADQATPTLLGSDLVPVPLAIIVMIGILAACISTIDSIMLTLSSMFTRDVYAVAKKGTSEKTQLIIGKAVLPVVALLAFWFAHLELDLIAVLSVAASAGLLVIVPPTVGAFFWKRGTGSAVIVSVIAAGAMVLGLEYTGYRFLNQGSGVWGLLVSTALFVGISLATPAPKERAEEFITSSRKPPKRKKSAEEPDEEEALAP
ncbi:sodium:solute symporter family protein [Nesterenkonia populi]|uniref:sodium:solute symporter family protein n=1 Tax=Nesterenkonia populi TaxID=1591087 RepID=UPI0011BE5C38|nr:sodium:solute symporter family protein [Nesterenkonia populi]